MSYGPPPTKTPYGDQDFIKEEFTSKPQAQSPFASGNLRGTASNSPYATPVHQMSNAQMTQPPGGAVNPAALDAQNLAAKLQSLTPEDRIFMRSWRQDSFYYRVMPLAAAGSGALYYYNHMKGLPHKIGRYLAVSFIAYTIGKWSYKDELRRRLETTPLNTPFIQALREIAGARSPISNTGEFSGDTQQVSDDGWIANDSSFPQMQPLGPQGQSPYTAYGQYNQGSQDAFQPHNSDLSSPNGELPTRSFTSYEELRAKNRGLMQK